MILPVVSVVIPTHNRSRLLEKAVQSVFKQSFQAFEIIIVDDASSDNTVDVLNRLKSLDTRVKVITHLNAKGGSQSRNEGIAASKGQWIAFLDDDDEWRPFKLEAQLQTLADYPKAIACSSAYFVHYPFKFRKAIFTPSHLSYEDLLKSNSLGGSSVCICDAHTAKQIGGFDESLKSSQDWDFWLRLRSVGDIVSVKKPLTHYYVHFNNRISNNMLSKHSGARRFYFKHKSKMTPAAKTAHLSFISFIKSRQINRGKQKRLYYLALAIKYSDLKTACAYFLSSGLRLFV